MAWIDKLPLLFPGMNLRPALACEISPYGVLAARQDAEQGLVTHFTAMPQAALEPGWRHANLADRPAVVTAVRSALGAVVEYGRGSGTTGKGRPTRAALTLIVPDAAVRVLLLDFEALPSSRQEALAVLRFRLRRLVPFETEDARVSWQTMGTTATGVRVLTLVMPRTVLEEYEGVVREAGFSPGVVLPSTLAALPLAGVDPSILVNRNGRTLTTAILRGQELLLHRSLELSGGPGQDSGADAGDSAPRPPVSAEDRALAEDEDIRQSVSVAMAYFEDTLAAPPEAIYYIGPGTPQEFGALLGEPAVPVRSMGEAPALPSRTVPPALLPPVTGALLNA